MLKNLFLFQTAPMKKTAYLLATLLFFAFPMVVFSQVLPKEGRKLNYRIIGFSFPALPKATGYILEIATGSHTSNEAFEKNIVSSSNCKDSRVIAEVPSFGKQYTWRVTSISAGAKSTGELHHFSTMMIPDVDTNVTRLRVTTQAAKYGQDFVFLDGVAVLYDMKGRPVWFLPDLGKNRNATRRDIRVSGSGTITFLAGSQPYEVDYNANILWQYKDRRTSGDVDTFHHEFVRLRNGHYMGMILEYYYRKHPEYGSMVARTAGDTALYYQRIQRNWVVEMDAKGHVVWKWNSEHYFANADLKFLTKSKAPYLDLNYHENSIYFDEQQKTIYLGFRDLERVVKLSYPQGKVLSTYGPKHSENEDPRQQVLFCGQHSVRLSSEGFLYLYNNNTCGNAVPTVMMVKDYPSNSDDLKVLWEYRCTIEDPSISARQAKFISGGNVSELQGGALFVSMGAPYCKTFIVNADKQLLWSAIPQRYDATKKQWQYFADLYRASMVTKKQLDQLIWGANR